MPKRKLKAKYKRKLQWFGLKVLLLVLVVAGLMKTSTTFLSEKPSSERLYSYLQTVKRYNFIRDIAPLAVKAQQEYKILPSITLAQACLESDFGQSQLASK